MGAFNDRFTINDPAFLPLVDSLDELTSDQLAQASPELSLMAAMVRRHSILIRSVPLSEIYAAITLHADPEISLVIAAAKSSEGSFRYTTEAAIKRFMFRPLDAVNTDSSIFVDGLRRVSAALAAALLVNSYAAAGQLQVEASAAIAEKAFSDLDRILATPDVTGRSNTAADTPDQTAKLYFSSEEIDLDFPLTLEYYVPRISGSTAWSTVQTYPEGSILLTKRIVSDLANAINAETLRLSDSANLLASAVLSAQPGFYSLEFAPRRAISGLSAEVVSIRFIYGDDATEPLPFRWGITLDALTTEWLNSLLLVPNRARYTTASETQRLEGAALNRTVLYLQQDSALTPPPSAKFSYRVSTSNTAEYTAEVFFTPTDTASERASQIAMLLLNSLLANRDANYLVGVILRNDSPSTPNPVVAVELVAWSITNPQTWITLDILETPADILTSVGDEQTPISEFSSLPKSLKVDSEFSRWFGRAAALQTTQNASPVLSKMSRSRMLDHVNDVSKVVSGFSYGGYDL